MPSQAREQPKDNLGFDNKADHNRKRTINPDGSFNIIRKNYFWQEFHLYRWAITCQWKTYWLVVLTIYISANFLFAFLYYLIGPEYIIGLDTETSRFWQCYFFSLQTFTTVGYGGLHPKGLLTNSLAGFEAFLGLMTFALATGALYGRFSKPEARIKYSANAIIAPYGQGGRAFMFMLCNNMSSNLAEVTAKINFSWVENDENNLPVRRFDNLKLEFEKVNMLALNWNVVHPIDEESPLYNLTEKDYIEKDVEFFILITANDDTFSQSVHSRNSYVGREVVHGAKFKRPFYVDEYGNTVLDVKNMGQYDLVTM